MKIVLATQTYAPVIGGEDLHACLAQVARVGRFTAEAVAPTIKLIYDQVLSERRRRA